MKQPTLLRTATAAAIVGVCLTGGGVALASADDGSSTTSPTIVKQADSSSGAQGERGQFKAGKFKGGPRGFRQRAGALFDVKDFAKALGVSEDQLKAALKKVMQENRPKNAPKPGAKPGAKPAKPGAKPGAGRPNAAKFKQRKAEFVKDLAKELKKSPSDVTKALDKVKQERKAERRDELTNRLDAAVKDHKLTATDEKSVLKAFDAGVLGGKK